MKNYSIIFTVEGPGGKTNVSSGPIACENLLEAIKVIAADFPKLHPDVKMVGIIVMEL